MNLVLTATLLGNLIITSYRSVPSQTDSSPFITSNGEHVCHDGVAVSQDWIISGKLKYGDWVYVEHLGLRRVNDVMNVRYARRMDVWVGSYQEEKEFDKKYGHTRLKVYLVKEIK